jgi:hypothetical protein
MVPSFSVRLRLRCVEEDAMAKTAAPTATWSLPPVRVRHRDRVAERISGLSFQHVGWRQLILPLNFMDSPHDRA